MNIAHFGTFDVQNFGDCLFPHIIEARLPQHNFFHVSPVGGKPWPDALNSITPKDLSNIDIDGVVIGGGNIISASTTTLPDYRSVSLFAYPTLWAGAAKLSIERDIPLVFNSPGVLDNCLYGFPGKIADLITEASSYISFRDEESSHIFCRKDYTRAKVIPDTVLEAARLLPGRFDLSEQSLENTERTFVVHLKSRNMYRGTEHVAKQLDQLAQKLDARPILVAIGRCHKDEEIITAVAPKMRSNPILLDNPQSLSEILQSIITSVAYFGSSMHGFIIATAFGIPGAMVTGNSDLHKYIGLVEQINMKNRLICDWHEICDSIDTLMEEPPSILKELNTLDEHWNNLESSLQSQRERPFLIRNGIKLWKPAFMIDKVIHNTRSVKRSYFPNK